MKPPLLVLCATDLSPDADRAVVAAHEMARLFGSRLVFVHAVPFSAPARVLFPHLVQRTTDRLMEVSRLAAETVTTRIATLTGRPADHIDVRVDVGSPDEVIVEAAEESGAGLLVLGVSGSDQSDPGLGDTALRIVRHAHCPILLVRSGPAKGPVLGATDLSEPAQEAVRTASFWAGERGEPLVTLHVVDFSPIVVVPEAFGPGIPIPVSGEEHNAILKAAEERLAESLEKAGIKGDRLIEEGVPAEQIVAAADEIDASLIVIGASGGGGLRRLLLGSVAEDVLRAAPCSVLVVRNQPAGHPTA